MNPDFDHPRYLGIDPARLALAVQLTLVREALGGWQGTRPPECVADTSARLRHEYLAAQRLYDEAADRLERHALNYPEAAAALGAVGR